MTAIQVAIQSIISQRAWGSILSVRIEQPGHSQNGQSVRARALTRNLLGMPAVGEVWRIDGELTQTNWGPQIEVQRAIREVPTGRLIEGFLASNIPGVGAERAARLWARWGMQLGDVLGDDTRIAEIAETIAPDRPTLGVSLASACTKAWQEAATSTQTLMWLARQGWDDIRLARKLITIFGGAAVEELQANPYVLVALLSWSQVDEVGLRFLREAGVDSPRHDSRRLVGAVDESVKRALRGGSTALTELALRESIAKRLGVVAHSPEVNRAIECGESVAAIQRARDHWRAPGCAAMEDELRTRLRALLALDYPVSVALPAPDRLERLLSVMRVGGHAIHPEQRAAVLALLQQPLGVLQGGAGVGKTTCLKAVCDIWANSGGTVIGTTVAGKAALRLSRSTGRLAMTLARLLGQLLERERLEAEITAGHLRPEQVAQTSKRLPELAELTPTTLVVIDEASMLDLPAAYELVRRLPPGARLLLVGDEAQLPPVGFGLVYHRLVDDDTITQRLLTVHRQTAASGIPLIAAAIRERRLPDLPRYAGKGDGVSLLAVRAQETQTAVVQVWDTLGGRESGTLICTATKAGDAGINALNVLLQRRHAERTGLATVKGFYAHWYCAGDPVVWLRNDYSRGLFNGLLGHVLCASPDDGLTVQFEGCDDPHLIAPEQLIDLALAYAITAHRAQGSQAPAVIVPLYRSRVLDPSWLYTAVTRAERQVVLVGDPDVLSSALTEPWAAKRRCVGLAW